MSAPLNRRAALGLIAAGAAVTLALLAVAVAAT